MHIAHLHLGERRELPHVLCVPACILLEEGEVDLLEWLGLASRHQLYIRCKATDRRFSHEGGGGVFFRRAKFIVRLRFVVTIVLGPHVLRHGDQGVDLRYLRGPPIAGLPRIELLGVRDLEQCAARWSLLLLGML